MKRLDLDWAYLRQGLLGAVSLTLVCTVIWGATTAYLSRATTTLADEEQTRSSLEAERNELTERRDARRKFARIFQQLSVNGVVGDEQRLALVQATRAAGQEVRLPYLRYTTNPQQPFEAPWLIPGVAAPVRVSLMDLQMGLVHELDLLRLFAELREAPGRPEVRSCSLEIMSVDKAPEPNRANIGGNCQLALYSIPRESTLVAANPEN